MEVEWAREQKSNNLLPFYYKQLMGSRNVAEFGFLLTVARQDCVLIKSRGQKLFSLFSNMKAGLILPSCGTLLHYMCPEKQV